MNKTELYIYLTKKLEDFFEMSFTNLFDEDKAYKSLVAEIREKCDPQDAYKYELSRVDERCAKARILNLFNVEIQ